MFFENSFIYFPTKAFYFRPEDYGLEYEDVFFTAEDGVKLHGWHVPAPGAKSAMLFFHGNAGNLCDRLDNVIRLHRQVGVDVFIIDYHGYGKSEGKPNEENLCMDGRAAMAELRKRIEGTGKKVIVFGRSLGGAVAADLCYREPCDGVILESTFTSVPDIANVLFPILPAGRVLRTRFESLKKIRSIKAPKLIIHGENDSLIPFSHGKALFEEAGPPREFYPIPGADHNDTYITAGEEYFEKIAAFVKTVEEEND